MKHLIWLAALPVWWFLVYQVGPEQHSEAVWAWADGRCERATDSAGSAVACKEAVESVHSECLREGYHPPTRYNHQSGMDQAQYWNCVSDHSDAAPPLKQPRRLRLSDDFG